MKSIFINIVVSVCLGVSFQAIAQTTGELENVEIEIVKERKIALPEAERKFSKITPHASEPISPPITYSFKPLNVELPLANLVVKPLKLKKESEPEAKRGYFSAGYGNFASPYLEAYYTSKRSAKQLVGASAIVDVWAKGPVDDRNSGNGIYGFSLFGASFGNTFKTDVNLSYNRSFWHFYGYPQDPAINIEAGNIRQHFDRFSLSATIANGSKSKFVYDLKGGFGYIQDAYAARESDVNLSFSSAYSLKPTRKVITNASYQLISRKDVLVEAKPRSLFQAEMLYTINPIDRLLIDVGFGVAYENDTLDKDFHFYPKAHARYELTKGVLAKASLSGQMRSVSLHTLTTENPWLAPNVLIQHTNEAFVLEAGLEAAFAKNFKAEVGASVASLRNLYFYTNDATDQSQFLLSYDDKATERINFYGIIDHAVSKRSVISLRADWFNYVTDTLSAAWHRPTYKVALQSTYNFFQKLKLSGGVTFLGGMKAYNFAEAKAVTLEPAIDFSLRAEYFVSDKLLLFIQGANLLSSDYNLYLNYPVRGAQVRAGFSWSF
ncbi:hypothetical protein [Chryseotalea sanaruensis]|nr:hypothetical protein [Chryseotalea sanaruensis]